MGYVDFLGSTKELILDLEYFFRHTDKTLPVKDVLTVVLGPILRKQLSSIINMPLSRFVGDKLHYQRYTKMIILQTFSSYVGNNIEIAKKKSNFNLKTYDLLSMQSWIDSEYLKLKEEHDKEEKRIKDEKDKSDEKKKKEAEKREKEKEELNLRRMGVKKVNLVEMQLLKKETGAQVFQIEYIKERKGNYPELTRDYIFNFTKRKEFQDFILDCGLQKLNENPIISLKLEAVGEGKDLNRIYQITTNDKRLIKYLENGVFLGPEENKAPDNLPI